MSDLHYEPERPEGPAPQGTAHSDATALTTRKKRARATRHPCLICGKDVAARDIVRLDVVRPNIIERIREERPDFPADGYICRADLDRYRSEYVSELLTRE